MRYVLLVALAAALAFPTAASAEGTLASEVARTGLWANTKQNSVAVWHSGSQPCLSDVTDRTYGTVWHRVPLPCYFKPDSTGDAEAIVRDDTGLAPHARYEMWTVQWNWGVPGKPNGWSAGYVTAGPDGVQGSGVLFEPGLPKLTELTAGRIGHMVQVEVPQACATFKAPAIRTDGAAGPNCVPYGQQYKLPAGTDCSLGVPAERMLCAAARDYGMIVTDQTHDKVIIRFEAVQPSPSPFNQPDPYYKVGGWFGCDGMQSGKPAAPGSEFDCYPTEHAAFWRFPWGQLVPTN